MGGGVRAGERERESSERVEGIAAKSYYIQCTSV
jgi:hypothetical protein